MTGLLSDQTALNTKYFNMSYFGLNDFFLEVAKGNVDGHSIVIIRGHNPDIDSATSEDIWEAGGTLSRLTSAETMDIVSSSSNDDGSPGGTGARTVVIAGCDGTGAAVTETITMNGTTGVTTANSYLRVNSMTVATAGSDDTNDGNITATASTAATVQCEMDAGEGLSMNSHYCVPLNKTGYIYKVELNAAKTSGGGQPVIEFKGYAQPTGAARLQLFDKKLDTALSDELDIPIPLPSAMAAQTDIWLHADTDTNNTEVRTRMYILLVDD